MSAGCRVYAHAWQPVNAWREGRKQQWTQELSCARCGSLRYDTVNREGIVIKRKYGYVRGYQRKGMGIMSSTERGWLRMNLLAAFAPPSLPGATIEDIPERPTTTPPRASERTA